jgi:hypothetical protein
VILTLDPLDARVGEERSIVNIQENEREFTARLAF